jgi:hypothetical protein
MALPFWGLVKATGGGPGFMVGALAAVAGALLWAKLVWPLVRRYFFLQFFVYFRMSDHPGLGGLLREALGMNAALKAWPSHLNVMCALTLAVVVGVFVIVETAAAMAPSLALREPLLVIANFVYLMAFLWPCTTAAGFYRLCLKPAEDVYLPGTMVPGGQRGQGSPEGTEPAGGGSGNVPDCAGEDCGVESSGDPPENGSSAADEEYNPGAGERGCRGGGGGEGGDRDS